jgi:ABC-2 type transport system ATP-binding protein
VDDPSVETAAAVRSLAVETRGLTRRFGDFVAVDAIDLAVPTGTLFGFLGPNGAGKSTTIKCLTGLLRPSGGALRILGLDPLAEPVEVKRRVGVVPEDLALFERLTGRETLSFVGQVHGLARAVLRERSDQLLDLVDLAGDADRLVADYSHGMRKKIALCAALLPSPRLLFLDEPFEGIDAVTSRQLKSLLAAYVQRGGTIFLTSHVLEIVERLARHVAVIHRGRIVAQGPVAELSGAGPGRSLEDIFLALVGADEAAAARDLDWLGS